MNGGERIMLEKDIVDDGGARRNLEGPLGVLNILYLESCTR